MSQGVYRAPAHAIQVSPSRRVPERTRGPDQAGERHTCWPDTCWSPISFLRSHGDDSYRCVGRTPCAARPPPPSGYDLRSHPSAVKSSSDERMLPVRDDVRLPHPGAQRGEAGPHLGSMPLLDRPSAFQPLHVLHAQGGQEFSTGDPRSRPYRSGGPASPPPGPRHLAATTRR